MRLLTISFSDSVPSSFGLYTTYQLCFSSGSDLCCYIYRGVQSNEEGTESLYEMVSNRTDYFAHCNLVAFSRAPVPIKQTTVYNSTCILSCASAQQQLSMIGQCICPVASNYKLVTVHELTTTCSVPSQHLLCVHSLHSLLRATPMSCLLRWWPSRWK